MTKIAKDSSVTWIRITLAFMALAVPLALGGVASFNQLKTNHENQKQLADERYNKLCEDMKSIVEKMATENSRIIKDLSEKLATSNSDLKDEIHRVDLQGCIPSMEARQRISVSEAKIEAYQADVKEFKADMKDIKTLLRKY